MRFNYYEKAKRYLEIEPLARKVENRATAVWNLIKIHQNPNLENMDKPAFIRYWSMAQSFDRAIRQVQNECKELSDGANDHKRYTAEQEKLKELGY